MPRVMPRVLHERSNDWDYHNPLVTSRETMQVYRYHTYSSNRIEIAMITLYINYVTMQIIYWLQWFESLERNHRRVWSMLDRLGCKKRIHSCTIKSFWMPRAIGSSKLRGTKSSLDSSYRYQCVWYCRESEAYTRTHLRSWSEFLRWFCRLMYSYFFEER